MPEAARPLPAPIAVGFFPKITQPGRLLGLEPPVAEICSVSLCISHGPVDWITHWRHNAFGFYDTEADAYRVIDGDQPAYDLYAYRLAPIRGRDGVVEPLTLTSQTDPIPETYLRLGWDVVTQSSSDFFECSPLSCNGAAQTFAVNRYCLFDEIADAYAAMLAMSLAGDYEPGPYFLFEVFRKPLPLAG